MDASKLNKACAMDVWEDVALGRTLGNMAMLQTFTVSSKSYHLVLCNYEWLGCLRGSIYMSELVNGYSFS